MANAIKQNLEMVDVLQASTNQTKQKNMLNSSMQGHHQYRTNGPDIQMDHQVEALPFKQGSTIKSDLAIEGSKIFSDAAWKTSKAPGADGRVKTGLGIFCQLQKEHSSSIVFIQASSEVVRSPLQAEALALLLAATLANLLHLQHVTFLTDNLTLARAATAFRTTDQQVPWEIRQHIAHFKNISLELEPKIYHIKRDLNGVAHNCAHQALRQSKSGPTFSCSNSAHVYGNCPVALALKNLNLQGIVLHVVNCS